MDMIFYVYILFYKHTKLHLFHKVNVSTYYAISGLVWSIFSTPLPMDCTFRVADSPDPSHKAMCITCLNE